MNKPVDSLVQLRLQQLEHENERLHDKGRRDPQAFAAVLLPQ